MMVLNIYHLLFYGIISMYHHHQMVNIHITLHIVLFLMTKYLLINHYILNLLSFLVLHNMEIHMQCLISHFININYLIQNLLFWYFIYHPLVNFLVWDLCGLYLIYVYILYHLLIINIVYKPYFLKFSYF